MQLPIGISEPVRQSVNGNPTTLLPPNSGKLLRTNPIFPMSWRAAQKSGCEKDLIAERKRKIKIGVDSFFIIYRITRDNFPISMTAIGTFGLEISCKIKVGAISAG